MINLMRILGPFLALLQTPFQRLHDKLEIGLCFEIAFSIGFHWIYSKTGKGTAWVVVSVAVCVTFLN